MKSVLIAALFGAACKETIQHGPDASTDAPADSLPPVDAPKPKLGCNPSTAAQSELCNCMANMVCDQIYYCLTATQLAAKPAYWSPIATCVASLKTDCDEDMASDPVAYFPTDFRACIADLETATCGDYGTFSSVANDFPASCQNLRALDTGLGISQ
jgi:hypothetical protein